MCVCVHVCVCVCVCLCAVSESLSPRNEIKLLFKPSGGWAEWAGLDGWGYMGGAGWAGLHGWMCTYALMVLPYDLQLKAYGKTIPPLYWLNDLQLTLAQLLGKLCSVTLSTKSCECQYEGCVVLHQ